MPTVLVTGGTGLVGKNLTRHLTQNGNNVIILTRKLPPPSGNPLVSYALWNIDQEQIDRLAIEKSDYIVHLAGAGVMDKRWTKKYKKEILHSRTASSQLLIKGLKEIKNNVKAVVSASAIGWYGATDNKSSLQNEEKEDYPVFKESDPAAKDFLGETCRLWEESIEPATNLDKRLVKLRFGIVLSNDGGALAEFKRPLRFGIAGILGDGKQVISWIHVDDICRMIIFALENEQLAGSYNAVAPEFVSNEKLTVELAQRLNKNFYIPVYVPSFLLRLFLGKRSIEILKSAAVSCEKIKLTGFRFLYPSIEAALDELTKRNNITGHRFETSLHK